MLQGGRTSQRSLKSAGGALNGRDVFYKDSRMLGEGSRQNYDSLSASTVGCKWRKMGKVSRTIASPSSRCLAWEGCQAKTRRFVPAWGYLPQSQRFSDRGGALSRHRVRGQVKPPRSEEPQCHTGKQLPCYVPSPFHFLSPLVVLLNTPFSQLCCAWLWASPKLSPWLQECGVKGGERGVKRAPPPTPIT